MSDHTDAPLDADLRTIDAALSTLFPPPDPTLEDRVIRSLRGETTMPKRKFGWRNHPLTWGVAASLGLGAVGAAVSQLTGDGLPLPWGTERIAALRDDRAMSSVENDHMTPILPAARNGFPLPRSDDAAPWTRGEVEAIVSEKELRGHSLADSRLAKPTMDDQTYAEKETKLKQLGGQHESFAAGGKDWDKSKKDGGAAPPANNLWSYYAPPTTPGQGLPNRGFSPDAYRWKAVDATKAMEDTVAVSTGLAVPTGGSQKPQTEYGFGTNGIVTRTVTKSTGGIETVPVTLTSGKTVTQPPVVADPAPANRKVILRSGDIEFEIDSFDSAVAAVTKLVVAIDGAFVTTVNSEKLPNGKVKGSVAVRVPPDKLDGLVLDLRRDLGKVGELKGQRIGSQDVTKQYTDTESRLKAARTMETRLLAIIKDGKGEIKQLLDAEKELGVWRTKIEEYEGELRYYSNLAALSTLTITLAEKEIKAAAGVTESEVVHTGVEVEDVEQAFRDALAAVAAANGRVTKSDLKQVSSGQFNATLNFEIAPDASGPVRDRLRQLGRVARLEITRSTTADTGTVTKDAKVKRGDTKFEVQLYNVTAMPPREAAALTVATPDVPARFRAVREAVEKVKGRVLAATLNESDKTNVTGQLDFEVKRADEAAVQAAIGSDAEVVSREVSRAAESDAVTDTKVLIRAKFVNPHRLPPRESFSLAVETADVDAAGAVLTAAVKDAGGRVADSGTATDRSTGKVTARYLFDVPLASAAGIADKAKAAGTVKVNQVSRSQAAPEGRFATARIEVIFATPDRIVAPDDGFGPQVKKGLSYSATALFASLTWLVFGLLVVLPWAVVLYAAVRVVRWLRRSPTPRP